MSRNDDRFVSYAGNHEDVLLHRAFRNQDTGFYIDVGAHHPTHGSNTKVLYDRGWNGVNLEPNPGVAGEFALHRTRDTSLTVGIGDRPGQLTFYKVPANPQRSTLSADAAARCRAEGLVVVEQAVEVTTLAAVCEAHVGDREIDVLTVDTEGAERQVLLGADFRRWRPKVLIIEATLPETNVPAHDEWESIVLSAGYMFTLFDGVNRVYVRSESPELVPPLSYPVNCLDRYIGVFAAEIEKRAVQYTDYGRPGRAAASVVMYLCKAVNRLIGRGQP